ncbi:MAG: hypothetical protein GF393_11745 [Armatimonadia bacterium]|nr:hypothetical protein [Armatimonadia bacterium]
MTDASLQRAWTSRILHRMAPAALITLLLLVAVGCERERQTARPAQIIDASHVTIVAWLDATSPCQQGTIEILRDIESEFPARVSVQIVDIARGEGRERWEQSELDAMAIVIDGNTCVSWGEGDSRRTVSFLHPAGFAWTHEDLRAAVQAALDGRLRSADPAEAEGVRLMEVSVRGQSIRVGDEGNETGQLIIRDTIALEITQSRGDLAPGQRVSAAADALNEVLQKPFTPNQLVLVRGEDDEIALMVGDVQVLVATPADVDEEAESPEALARQWRRAVREALVDAALSRPPAPEPEPEPLPEIPADEPQTPTNDPGELLLDPLRPGS